MFVAVKLCIQIELTEEMVKEIIQNPNSSCVWHIEPKVKNESCSIEKV